MYAWNQTLGGNDHLRQRHSHQVAARALRFIELLIRFPHQRRKIHGILTVKSCRSKTCLHVYAPPLKWKRQRRELLAKLVDRERNLPGLYVSPPAKNSSPPRRPNIRCARIFLQYIRKVFSTMSPASCPNSIVNGLEAINVCQHHPHPVSVSCCSTQLPQRPLQSRAVR